MRLYSVLDNLVLRAVSKGKRLPVGRKLKHIKFEAGDRFWEENEQLPCVLFPLAGVVSLRIAAGAHKQVETVVVGREGFAEVSALVGATHTRASAVALTSGEGLAMAPDLFRTCLKQSGFRSAAEAYTRLYLVMMERISVCNRVHGIDALCAGRLLLMHDRTGRQSFDITQDAFARQVGVRRASISRAANHLRKHNAIHYDRRGRLTILDRAQLEKFACPCYHSMKSDFDDLVRSRGGL